jgi:hypothetical protein
MEEWIKECERFQTWFANLGGDISNNEQMMEAFNQIEIKKQSDNRLIELLDNDRINDLQVLEFTKL